jgi:hypothetical protein
MSRLDELAKRAVEKDLRAGKKGKGRIATDPTMSVSAIETALKSFLTRAQSTDLWVALVPPPNGPRAWSWKSRIHAPWAVKVSPLMYDLIVDVPAKNSKVSSTKLVAALKALLCSSSLTNSSGKEEEAFVSSVDVTIRILLSWFRRMKQDCEAREAVVRRLSAVDKKKARASRGIFCACLCANLYAVVSCVR